MCQKLRSKPNAGILAKLFGGDRKRPRFDSSTPPPDRNKAKKPRNVTVVLLENQQKVVPRGINRRILDDDGRIKKLDFRRSMSASAVKEKISAGFSKNLEKAVYMRCSQSNILKIHDQQELNGDEFIQLAGQGSVYLCENVS